MAMAAVMMFEAAFPSQVFAEEEIVFEDEAYEPEQDLMMDAPDPGDDIYDDAYADDQSRLSDEDWDEDFASWEDGGLIDDLFLDDDTALKTTLIIPD